ncbi:3'-5' exonuclease [Streptomyces sp.]|uniref:3'-5' exonuclease n=1 Tax=Streptomyces sp. TaxID=1931 RepID=UPI002F939915
MNWHLGRLCGFDLETTGIDVESDRIVTACVVGCGGGQPTDSRTWLADPGIEIPDGAAKVHGITTEKARAEGRPAADVIAELVTALASAARDGEPIVAMNAAYDLTLLDRECARHGVKSLWDYTDAIPLVVDPRVLDKRVDRFRRGGRTLTDLTKHYRVPLDGAHTADADAIAACRVAWRIATQNGQIADLALPDLHEQQVEWAREQAGSLRDYFAKTPGKEHQAASVRTEWPLIPRQQNGADQ